MEVRVGQMSKSHQKVGTMNRINQRMGSKISHHATIKSLEPSSHQIQQTTEEYNKYSK